MRHWGISVVFLSCLAPCLWGCASSAASDSVGSSSDIISSPFESASSSSGGEDSAYLGDVETLVLAYLETPAAPASFLRDLARVAREHGISDWEADVRTSAAVGAGLRRAGASRAELDAFVDRYLAALPRAAEGVRQGWAGAPAA